MVSNKIQSQAAKSFGFDPGTLTFVSNSCNEVYRFHKGNRTFFLRLSEKPAEFEMNIKAEVHWVRYLAESGVRVALPVETIEGELTAICHDHENEKCFIATVFEEAPGKFFDSDPVLWGPSLFKTWGETMGVIHRLAKTYDSGDKKLKRMDWRPAEIHNPHLYQGHYFLLLSRLRAVEKLLEALPRNNHSYGLIHYDFHPYNFLIDHGEITLFDFDDSLHGWFAMDMGISAAHAVWWGSHLTKCESKSEFAKHFLYEFLEGYVKQNSMEQEWIQRIPLFMEYRNISSYFWWLYHWDGNEEHLTEFQKNAIVDAVNRIENDIPFDGCDIQL